ncbi:MAG: FecR family protein, partial [Mariprofundaceae bacterium]|nr:FecR family protein [Mariprofundaceae bacterium]
MLVSTQVQAADFAGTITYSSGEAWVLRGQEKHPAPIATKILPGDVVVTRKAGRVKLSMNDGSTVFLGEKSRLVVDNYQVDNKTLKKGVFNLLWGKVRLQVAKLKGADSSFSVKTKTATIGVRGTQFAVMYPKRGIPKNIEIAPVKDIDIQVAPTTVMLFEGAVLARNIKGIERAIKPGTLASISSAGRISIRPIIKNDLNRLGLEAIVPTVIPPQPPKKIKPKIAPPAAAAQKIGAAKIETPEIKAPEVKTPEIRKPELEKPEIEAPEIKKVKINAPKLKKLEIDEPKFKKLKAPKLKKLRIEAPEIEKPEIKKLRIDAPKVENVRIEAPKIEKVRIEAPKIEKVRIEA